MKVKNFKDWIKEDFASLDSTTGMGDVLAPTSTSVGSGDVWPQLSATCETCKKTKCICKSNNEMALSDITAKKILSFFDKANDIEKNKCSNILTGHDGMTTEDLEHYILDMDYEEIKQIEKEIF